MTSDLSTRARKRLALNTTLACVISSFFIFWCLSQASSFGQTVPMPPASAPVTWYASVFAFDGVNLSNSGSPEIAWNGRVNISWPGYTNRVAALIGTRSHSYSRMIDAGTNASIIWPPMVPVPVYNFFYGGQFITTSTSQPAPVFLKAFVGRSNLVDIGLSTDGLSYSPLKILSGTNSTWTITKQ